MNYDVFVRMDDNWSVPKNYPYTVTMLMADGSFVEKTLHSWADVDFRKAVSVKFHKPNPLEQLTTKLAADMGITAPARRASLGRVLHFLNERGLLNFNQQSEPFTPKKDWLDQKLDQLQIRYKQTRTDIRNWFENPDKYPTTDMVKDNAILTVKSVAGGRVVVAPSGHTIAYSTAKEIAKQVLCGEYYLGGNRPTVGEYQGRQRGIQYIRTELSINKYSVRIGCQTIPRQAIQDLAEREGWV